MDELLLPTLCVDGCGLAVVWSQAVDEYLHNPLLVGGVDERGRTVCPDCGCSEFDSPCNGGTFTTPAADGMPWVVAGRAETNEFLGIRVKPGTEMALRGKITQDGADDWTSGLVGSGKATLTGTFQVCGITSRGVRYGYNWFGRTLRWRDDCSCQASTLTVWLWCDPIASCGRRYLRGARVVEFAIDDQNPNLPGCHAIDVNVTWEIEDPRLWLDASTLVDTYDTDWVIDMASKFCDACNPMSVCTPESQGLIPVSYSEERARRPVDVRSDGTWCPVGTYPLGDLQLFGGEGVATADTFTKVEPEPCNICTNYGIRLLWNQTQGGAETMQFETVRWTNPNWLAQRMPGVGCDCSVNIVELKRVYLDTSTNPPQVKQEVTAYSAPADDTTSDCCLVQLNWTDPQGGAAVALSSFSSAAAPRTSWDPISAQDIALGSRDLPQISGWPPVGCTLKVYRPDCRPEQPSLATCSGKTLQVRLWGDGTWQPVGWSHNKFSSAEWPPANVDLVVGNQIEASVTRVVYQPATEIACQPGADLATFVPPPLDPSLDDIIPVDWCSTASTCAYPWLIPAGSCERYSQLIVTVAAGASDVRWLRWALWERNTDWGNMDSAASREHYRTAEPIAVGEVPALSAGQKVIFDGQQGRILLECSSTVVESEMAAYGPSGVFNHPTLDGGRDYILAFVPYPWRTPTDTWYRVDVVEWEAV